MRRPSGGQVHCNGTVGAKAGGRKQNGMPVMRSLTAVSQGCRHVLRLCSAHSALQRAKKGCAGEPGSRAAAAAAEGGRDGCGGAGSSATGERGMLALAAAAAGNGQLAKGGGWAGGAAATAVQSAAGLRRLCRPTRQPSAALNRTLECVHTARRWIQHLHPWLGLLPPHRAHSGFQQHAERISGSNSVVGAGLGSKKRAQANAGAPTSCRPIRAASRFTSCCISYSSRWRTPRPTSRASLFASHAHSACPPPRTVLAGVQNAADDGADRAPVPPTAVPPPGRPPPVPQRRRRHDDATGKPAWMHSFLILQHVGRRLTPRLPLRLSPCSPPPRQPPRQRAAQRWRPQQAMERGPGTWTSCS